MEARDPFLELARSKPADLDTWASSPAGRATLHQALTGATSSSDEGRVPRTARFHRWRYTVPVAAAGALAALAMALTQVLPLDPDVNAPSGATTELSTSYAFDVTDLGTLMANADGAAVIEVVSVVADNEDSATRTYEAEVVRPIFGNMLKGSVTLNQNGYVDDDGVSHVLAGQPLLAVGSRYLVVTGDSPEGPIVTAGPLSVRPVADGPDEDSLVRRYRSAAK